MTLDKFNNVSLDEVQQLFRQCCSSEAWVKRMAEDRPYASAEALLLAADRNWLEMTEADYLQAFEGHPKIGDITSLKTKYANTQKLASGEQSAVDEAGDEILQKLAQGNEAYQEKFGFIFIVCATGKSATEMLALLDMRLPNERATELINAVEEQRKIFHIRLGKML